MKYCKRGDHIKLPKNYRESSILEFAAFKKLRRWTSTLMFMLNPDPDETFTPVTTYIPVVKRNQWLKEQMIYNDNDFMLEVCSILSHEAIHLVLARNIGRKQCDKLDPIFGVSWVESYSDVNGLLNFKSNFKPRKRKIKAWK